MKEDDEGEGGFWEHNHVGYGCERIVKATVRFIRTGRFEREFWSRSMTEEIPSRVNLLFMLAIAWEDALGCKPPTVKMPTLSLCRSKYRTAVGEGQDDWRRDMGRKIDEGIECQSPLGSQLSFSGVEFVSPSSTLSILPRREPNAEATIVADCAVFRE